jgi:Ca2+-binding RTX toxin-like protein
MLVRLALALLIVGLALPAAASAATVSVLSDPRAGDRVLYVAHDGEANDLTIESGPGTIVLTDSGADIAAGSGCSTTGAHSASCAADCLGECVTAQLGDEKDHFTSEGPTFSVDGGTGDDVLGGGDGYGGLLGGEGDDVLTGGGYATSLLGDAGDDELNGRDGPDFLMGGPGADAIDGGGQPDDLGTFRDAVSYRDHTEPVTIDLSTPGSPAGAAGEGDTLTNVENAYGGDGDDDITAIQDPTANGWGSVLDGSGGNDAIHGGPARDLLGGGTGDDTVEGGGGNDQLGGEEGLDRLDGGAGTNRVLSMDGGQPQRDLVDCGDSGSVAPGVATVPLLDVIDQSCRRVAFEYLPIRDVRYGYSGQPTRAVDSTVACRRHCLVTIVLRWRGNLVGSAEREIRRGHNGTLTIALTREARERLVETGVLKLRFAMHVKWGQRLRHEQATSWQLRLHDPPAARY